MAPIAAAIAPLQTQVAAGHGVAANGLAHFAVPPDVRGLSPTSVELCPSGRRRQTRRLQRDFEQLIVGSKTAPFFAKVRIGVRQSPGGGTPAAPLAMVSVSVEIERPARAIAINPRKWPVGVVRQQPAAERPCANQSDSRCFLSDRMASAPEALAAG